MKRLLIVPALALAVAMLAPAAYANHGGAQGPDIEEADDRCQVAYVFHASCTITQAQEDRIYMSAKSGGVPTADGWHVAFNYRVVDNANDLILQNGSTDITIPYTADWFDLGVPHPNLNLTSGVGTGGGAAQTTDATCLVDVTVGSGRTIGCKFVGADPFLLPQNTPF